ncbi:hypothetical protein CRYUN_Cryun18bG0080100 [Craigia yunnanensis]
MPATAELFLICLCLQDEQGRVLYMRRSENTSGGLAFYFSSTCDDNQISSDTTAFTRTLTRTGAMTFSFIQAVQNEPGLTYGCLLNATHNAIRDAKAGAGRGNSNLEPHFGAFTRTLTRTGAMTFSFIQAVQNEPGLTYGCLLNAMHNAIRDAKAGLCLTGQLLLSLTKFSLEPHHRSHSYLRQRNLTSIVVLTKLPTTIGFVIYNDGMETSCNRSLDCKVLAKIFLISPL